MGNHHTQAFLPPGNTQYSMYRRVGAPWGAHVIESIKISLYAINRQGDSTAIIVSGC